MSEQDIINEIKSLEAFFLTGLKAATGLRKRLEGASAPASPSGGLSEMDKAKLLSKRSRSIVRKQLAK